MSNIESQNPASSGIKIISFEVVQEHGLRYREDARLLAELRSLKEVLSNTQPLLAKTVLTYGDVQELLGGKSLRYVQEFVRSGELGTVGEGLVSKRQFDAFLAWRESESKRQTPPRRPKRRSPARTQSPRGKSTIAIASARASSDDST